MRSKYKNQKGPRLIESNLRRNGIDKNIIRKTMLSYSNQDWEIAAVMALQKKTLSKEISTNEKKIEKQKAFLEMRGFGFSIIENAIKEFWNS